MAAFHKNNRAKANGGDSAASSAEPSLFAVGAGGDAIVLSNSNERKRKDGFSSILKALCDFVWGPVMLILLVGTGVFLTIRLKFLPWRNLGYAIKSVFRKTDDQEKNHSGDISPFQSLMTALAATIGTGNIVGVATAMVLGGPGRTRVDVDQRAVWPVHQIR